MGKIKMSLYIGKEHDNLFLETNEKVRLIYHINGFMSEDEFVDSFESDAKEFNTLENEKTTLDSIMQIDFDYMLEFHIFVFGMKEVEVYQFKSNKLRNLHKLHDNVYEIPCEKSYSIDNWKVAAMLADHFYSIINHEENLFPFPEKMLYNFLFQEQEKLYRSNIFSHYDFIDEVNEFREKHGIQFEHSEGTEIILSSLYVMRKYLNIEWVEIYRLLEKGKHMTKPDLRNFIANIDEELMSVWDKVEFGSIKVQVQDELGEKKVDTTELLNSIKSTFNAENREDVKGVYLIYSNNELFYVGESKKSVYSRLKRHFSKEEKVKNGEGPKRYNFFKDLLEGDLRVDILRMKEGLEYRRILEEIITLSERPKYKQSIDMDYVAPAGYEEDLESHTNK
ncbi:GIY-YIG nuclease family protein [Salinicoccus luteus]|uniref:GIY-YIG nuclease family protein n=1 Tax=Salinicoccus luteus TaxID=367840 RepID=UPI0004E1DAF1|nr:GIY-YIG nuclease family protein [Salinicoccus luteus]